MGMDTTQFPLRDVEWREQVAIREDTKWYVAYFSRLGGYTRGK